MYKKSFSKVTIYCLLIAMLFVGMMTACGQNSGTNGQQDGKADVNSTKETYPFNYTDVLGREVTIEKQPEKIVSALPSNTEILFAIGLGDKVVGVTDYCDFPSEAATKEKIGDAFQLNVEKIVSLEPDIVLSGNGIPQEIITKLEEAGITVVAIEGTSFEETYKSIEDIGKITDAASKGKQIVKDMQAKVKDIEKKVEGAEKKDIYFVLGYGEYGDWTAGPGSFINEMIERASGNNIAADSEMAWAEYSLEKLVEKDPDVLIVSSMAGELDDIKKAQGYKDIKAVKEDNVKSVDANIVTRPSPRIVDGLEEIAKAIHPELFK